MDNFGPCEICGHNDWSLRYSGPVRDGKFGNARDNGHVAACGGCGSLRLDENSCFDDSLYESASYREKLQAGLDTRSWYDEHDLLQIFSLNALWPRGLRDKTIADIGCGGGSFLDHASGPAAKSLAIEPFDVYRQTLKEKGYETWPFVRDALPTRAGSVDMAFSFQVIEHILDPRAFLSEIHDLMAPEGYLLLSTPNLDDILMKLLPEDYPPFFYRVVHRWYFNEASLKKCAELAGFTHIETRHVHRFGMGNMVNWLKQRAPKGRANVDGLDKMADDLWKAWLEQTGQADCLFMLMQKPAS